jgi:hypothetical protein
VETEKFVFGDFAELLLIGVVDVFLGSGGDMRLRAFFAQALADDLADKLAKLELVFEAERIGFADGLTQSNKIKDLT